MKTIFYILLITLGINQCQTKERGLEIYQVKKLYPDFTKEKQPECYYCLDINTKDLFEKPLLVQKDFKHFDWNNQQIELTEVGKQKIKKLNIPLQGLPVAMVLNGEIIYGFWFWNEVSSFGCDRVYTYPTLDFNLKFSSSKKFRYGKDPRFDKRLEKYINKFKKN